MMPAKYMYYIRITGIMLLITACAALLLASVNALTEDKIEENRLNEFMRAVEIIFPVSTEIIENPISVESPVSIVYDVKNSDEHIGYCIKTIPKGFDGNIELIVGTDLYGNIIGVQVVSHSETPGLGSRAADESYLSAYIGLSGEIKFKQNIDAVAGATITSRAVLSGVNAALAIDGLFDNGGAAE